MSRSGSVVYDYQACNLGIFIDMDEEMWEAVELGFSVQVFDAVYEFDAPQYFNFTSPQSYSGAQEVELWFETAPSCSPSSFIIKLNLKHLDNVNIAQKSKYGQNMDSYCNDSDMGIEVSKIDENNREECHDWGCCSHQQQQGQDCNGCNRRRCHCYCCRVPELSDLNK